MPKQPRRPKPKRPPSEPVHAGRVLDPKNDIAFRKLFGSLDHSDVLIDFLNNMVGESLPAPIAEISLLPTNMFPEAAKEKYCVFDILCKDPHGSHFIIEMQIGGLQNFKKRAAYYVSRAYSAQLLTGISYGDLKPVIFLAIVKGQLFGKEEGYKSRHTIVSTKTGKQHIDEFAFYFIELEKFTKTLSELKTTEDKWIYFFKNATQEVEIPPGWDSTSSLHKAFALMEKMRWEPFELVAYDIAHLKVFDHDESLAFAKDQGLAEGLEKGREEGLILAARGMHQSGLTLEVIAKSLHVPVDQIRKWLGR